MTERDLGWMEMTPPADGSGRIVTLASALMGEMRALFVADTKERVNVSAPSMRESSFVVTVMVFRLTP